MKKLLYILPILLLAAACHKEGSVQVVETLSVSSPAPTRVHLADGVSAVWNAGDQVSVFYNGGENEKWNYTGADGASKGTISHEGNSWRIGNGNFTALYPYDSGASMTGEVISTTIPSVQAFDPDSYTWAMLVSSTDDASLHFEYACAFVRLSLSGIGKVRSVTLKGGSNEALAGPCSVDISAGAPAAVPGSGATSSVTVNKADGSLLASLSATETDVWIGVLPGTFNKGLVFTVTLESGNTEDIQVSGPVTLKAGEVFCVHGRLFGFETVTIDFVSNPSAFSPALPTSAFNSHSDGTHTYTVNGKSYTLSFHPAYHATSYGYGMYSNEYGKSLLLGRNGAWIKLPVMAGYALFEAEYEAGSLSGHPYLSDNASNPLSRMLSNQVSDTTPGSSYSMTLGNPETGKQYYLVVGSGNLLMRKLILRYTKLN